MTTELIDLRTKITELSDKWLDIESNVTGRDRAEIVREILHRHAQLEVDNFNLRQEAYSAKGLLRENRGIARGKHD